MSVEFVEYRVCPYNLTNEYVKYEFLKSRSLNKLFDSNLGYIRNNSTKFIDYLVDVLKSSYFSKVFRILITALLCKF